MKNLTTLLISTLFIATFGFGQVSFSSHTITSSIGQAVSVFAIDVDGDGDMDVLAASRDGDKVEWYENNGSESFTTHIITSSTDDAMSVFAIDVDGDGDIDVLSASRMDDKIAWYENNGSESFTAHTITSSADNAMSVFAIDLDGDGDIDVLSASGSDDKIAWYENNGSESFTAHTITSSADLASSVFAIDVDGDGDIDVLSASQSDDTVNWYENDGSQNFTTNTISSNAGDHPRSVYAIDLDEDGDIDVLSAFFEGDKIVWYENNGSETFTTHDIYTNTDQGMSVFAIDMDGDNDIDVLSASDGANNVSWHENNGSQSFTTHTITSSANGPASVYAIDVDGDGDIDVLSASIGGEKIEWHENLMPYSGPIFYVSTTGSDDNDGSSSLPFATIQKGIDSASSGDTVLVSAGTYVENINFNGKNIVVGSLYLTTSDTSYISSTIIDGNQSGSVVSFANGEDSTAVLNGFTVINGNGFETYVYQPNILGGGILCNGSSPIISNCIITDNQADIGGGVGCINSANPIIKNVRIENNNANYGNWGGGGIACLLGASPKVFDSVINNNNAVYGGGGLYSRESNPNIINSLFSGNSAGRGGGLWAGGAPIVTNCTFTKNMVNADEGDRPWGSSIYMDGNLNVINSNFWNNITQIMDPMEDTLISVTYNQSIVFEGNASSMNLNISYSNVQGGQEGIYLVGSNSSISWGDGNINTDPFFVDAANDDYHLADWSPCIGAGTATDAHEPIPQGSNPDMGAYENALGAPVEHILITNDSLIVLEDSSSTIDLLDNDLILNITSFTLAIVDSADNGTIALVGDSAFTYTPNENFFGYDSITYSVFSSNAVDTGQVFITVMAVNDVPALVSIGSHTTNEDTAKVITLSATDIDGDNLTYAVSSLDTNVTTIVSNDTLTMTPAINWYGSANITVVVTDDGTNTLSDTTTFILTVNAINDEPVLATIGSQTTNEDTAKVITLSATDVEGDSLTYTASSSDTNVTAAINVTTLILTPAADWMGTANITVTVTDDGTGTLSDSETFTFTVYSIDDLPVVANPLSDITVSEDAPDTTLGDLKNVFLDVDEELIYSHTVNDTGLVFVSVTNDTVTLQFLTDANGSTEIVFTATNPIIRASVSDTILVTVLAVNDTPDATDMFITVDEDSVYNGIMTVADIEGDTLIYSIISDPQHGNATIINHATGSFSYTPESDYNGMDSLSFHASDGDQSSDTATAHITVNPVDDPPVVVNPLSDITVNEDSPDTTIIAYLDQVFGDIDSELNYSYEIEDTLLYSVTVNTDTVTLQLFADANGTSDIIITATNPTTRATVSDTALVTVLPMNDAPEIVSSIPDTSMAEDHTLSLLIQVYDMDGDSLTIYGGSDTGAVNVNWDGELITMTSALDWNGSAGITVIVMDDSSAGDTANFTLTVEPANDPPEEFSVIYPTVSDTFSTHADNDTLIQFTWGKSNDVDSDITYNLTIELEYFGNTYTDIHENISDTTIGVSSNSLDPILEMTSQDETVITYWVHTVDEEYTVVSDTGEFVLSRAALGAVDGYAIPDEFALHQNYPNPFNPVTTLRYDLPENALVNITIYDMLGRQVKALMDQTQDAGYRSVIWDATNDYGKPVSAGMYLYQIQAGEYISTKKMVLLK